MGVWWSPGEEPDARDMLVIDILYAAIVVTAFAFLCGAFVILAVY